MKVDGHAYRTIWLKPAEATTVCVIDQRILPHRFEVVEIKSSAEMVEAIQGMTVRGAPLIGVAAGYGMYLAGLHASQSADFEGQMRLAAEKLLLSRPTAVNLAWAVGLQKQILDKGLAPAAAVEALRHNAELIAEQDIDCCRRIADFGLEIVRPIAARKDGQPVQILTHCNAGWLCAVDWGTATAPIYRAFNEGIDVHVWVDETRPRNQGASLTAWELGQHGVPYTLITDNAGGHLMQNGQVDMVIVGTDRVTRRGDVANKIGTYLKALAAHANSVPFYVAAPSSSIDWSLLSGKDIPIEERSAEEVKYISGLCDGQLKKVLIAPEDARAANFGFDVTPNELIAALITERGVTPATEDGLGKLFPEKLRVSQRER